MKRLGLSFLIALLGLGSLGLQSPPASPQPKASAAPLFLEGLVKGPDGKPLENALVLARALNSSDPPDSIKTDVSGRFRIAARKPSSHFLRVEAKGFAAKTLERVVLGKPLEIVLQKGAIIQGTVLDGRTAEPVEGARVEARSGDASFSLLSDPSVGVDAAVTDAKGRFKIENLAPGLHSLSADARGYGRASRNAVASGGTAQLYLFPGSSIAGMVRDADDKPVAGAVVRAETDMPMRSQPTRAEITSADGRFVLVGIEAGTYRLAVRHKDYAPAIVPDVAVRAETEAEADVVLSAGGRIIGRLRDPDGRPLKGRATLAELDGKPAGRGLSDLFRADTDLEGRFRLPSAPPGSHVLSLTAPGFAPTRLDVSVRDGNETDAGDIVLEAGLSIRGTVKSKSGAPLPEAMVSASQAGSMPMAPVSAPVEADGSFILSGIGPGRHQVRAIAPGYAEAHKQVDAGMDAIDLVLSPAGSLTGLVVDDAGQPIESFRVTARSSAPPAPNTIVSFASKSFGSADGRFSLDLSGEGPHLVEVSAPNHAAAAVSGVNVVLGQSVDVGRIRLSSGGSVRGQVVDGAGAPVPAATVTVRGAGRDLGPAPQGTSDATGTFDVRGVPAGTVEAVASHPLFAEGRATGVEVDPSKGPAETRIVVTRGGRVEGSVRRRDGAGIPGMMVTIFPTQPTESGSPRVVTEGDGTFMLDHVYPGRVRATLMAGSGGRYTNVQDRQIDVREGETTTVEFVSRDILLSGRATRNGEPAPGLRLTLSGQSFRAMMSASGLDQVRPSGPQRMTAVTDTDGRYEMIVNEPGKLLMVVDSADSRVSYPRRSVDVPDVDALTLDLAFNGAPVSGVVVDKETGQPVAEANVSASAKKPPPGAMFGGGSVTSGPDGRFQMELEPAEYRLNARARGYAPGSLEVTVGASGAQEVRLGLGRGVALEGRIVDERGRGIGGLNVFAFMSADSGQPSTPPSFGNDTTEADGAFVIEGLQQRPHVVQARSSIGGFAWQSNVSPGDKDVVLTLKPAGMLRIRALGPDGAPLAGASISLIKVNETRVTGMQNGLTDAQGGAELQVPGGELEIRVTKEKLQAIATVSVAERGAATLEVKLSGGPPKPPPR